MTAATELTIDECIADSEADVMLLAQIPEAEKQLAIATANLDFLRAHKRITESAGRPEPVANVEVCEAGERYIFSSLKPLPPGDHYLYGPDLLAYADRAAAEYRKSGGTNKYEGHTLHEWWERAINAERQLDELQRKHDGLVAQYDDLIMQVATKWPNETRHETARRYIQQAEDRPVSAAMSAVALDEKGGE